MINATEFHNDSYGYTPVVNTYVIPYETEIARRLLLIIILTSISTHLVSVQLCLISIISKHYLIPLHHCV